VTYVQLAGSIALGIATYLAMGFAFRWYYRRNIRNKMIKALEAELSRKNRDRDRKRQPIDHEVYDAYPQLMISLMEWAIYSTRFPLPEMIAANDRIQGTSAFVGPAKTLSVNPDALHAQRQLLDAVTAFREKCSEIIFSEEQQ
jgi:hypothetical protein